MTASDLSAEASAKGEVEIYENNYREIANFLIKEWVKTVENQGVCEHSGSSSFATPLLETSATQGFQRWRANVKEVPLETVGKKWFPNFVKGTNYFIKEETEWTVRRRNG